MKKKITVLPGDGIGPEVVQSAVNVLDTVADQFGHEFEYSYAKIGGVAIDEENSPLPSETVRVCKESDGILLGAVGGPKWDTLPGDMRPEKGLLGIRKELNLFANLRPVTAFDSLIEASTLRKEVVKGVDLMILRELTSGLYFGEPKERREENGEQVVVDTLYYKRSEIERIIKQAFELARVRRKKVTSVDKANVLESSRVWREVAEEVGKQYPDIELEHMLVDNAAMQLIRDPKQFDVLVTENMFGDILSDEASMLTGSLGMLPSASIGSTGPGLYEPVHGSAPDIAGQGKANPLATIASVAMMLKYSFGLSKEAEVVDKAVSTVLEQGYRTGDIAAEGETTLSTTEMTEKVIAAMTNQAKVTN
ncbi:3-isopropylmalate dehydrogenase [Desertibacillus haloalkaliphilus]|uniref:3-isopropylmalate dehydrogenase n=1 Tax=Desertibacillus haloalkaliphilus TaxID=1328930 RepID=UPI001C26B19A|nr:3-isopropylmalate dehydrogenase [Desertibacillus haloalkaliphilus]MBU8905081.1 3-isopropylmalate dehydrogenase [Desertibacillus haloalkaliphilus]